MIRSMTGYGRGECELHDRTITVELRAVNNRYLDCSVKIPRVYVFAEEAIKSQVQKQVGRGKVDVFVAVDSSAADQVAVTLNRPVADGYYAALKQMRDVYDLKDDLSVSLLSRFPDVFLVEKEQGDADVIAQDIVQVLSQALEDFNAMRQREGEKLAEDILGKAQRIRQLVTQVEERSPATVAEYREKLRQRMEEVLSNTQIDESRILTEAAIFADKVAVDEETVRLRSHLSQLEEMLREGGAIGRKLDFLIQEFNREANTIGSKCSDVELARVVVELKGEIEKIREQVQNIE
ncbi:YicC/YloC family endoribonuclease [Evtepia sp.]|uniref:YicC/YloC family endoribonuclease n=1 Tax=Evtepia sp. TaxID=2773933 RepID=UPI002A76416A|nr:YicC/YloC family endoribonuclease [Evtepia sp.]